MQLIQTMGATNTASPNSSHSTHIRHKSCRPPKCPKYKKEGIFLKGLPCVIIPSSVTAQGFADQCQLLPQEDEHPCRLQAKIPGADFSNIFLWAFRRKRAFGTALTTANKLKNDTGEGQPLRPTLSRRRNEHWQQNLPITPN